VALVCAVFAVITAGGCVEYDAPPDATLVRPDEGAFEVEEPLMLEFSEPIDPDSLSVRVWPNERDAEGELAQAVQPLVEPCTPDNSPCDTLTLTVADDAQSASVEWSEALKETGRPLLLEVLTGLADDEGNKTGVNYLFDFQFRGKRRLNDEPVDFDNGIYVIGASVENPLPAVLTLVSDLRVLESGDFVLAGASAKVNDDAPKASVEPEDVYVNTTSKGWSVYATGFVTLQDDGARLLETDPFDAFVPLGTFDVYLDQVRIFATIKKDEDGNDSLDGTLTYEQVRLDRQTFEGDTTSLRAKFVPDEKSLEGSPDMCSDLCGGIVGHCEPPEDFPPTEFCE
jgi:hypothetical protein